MCKNKETLFLCRTSKPTDRVIQYSTDSNRGRCFQIATNIILAYTYVYVCVYI